MKQLVHQVKEIKITEDVAEVNERVKENWILLHIASNNLKTSYAIGRI